MQRRQVRRFTRREDQILEILYRRGEASVADLMALLPGAPTAGATRRLLNILHGKGAIAYRHDGAKKIYRATVGRTEAGTRALSRIVDTFFGGSAVETMGALFKSAKGKLSDQDRQALAALIEMSKRKGR